MDSLDTEEDTEIPVGRRPQPQIPRDEEPPPPRYRYTTTYPQYTKKIIIIGAFVAAIVALIVGLYGFPVWHAGISLQRQLYSTKSDFDFWELYTMNFWSTAFFFNKIGLIGGLIGAIIFSVPPETTILSIIGTRRGTGRPSPGKALLFNWTIGFLFFYLIGQMLDSGYFALVMYSIEKGAFSYNIFSSFNAMNVLFDIDSVTILDIYVYTNVVYPIVGYIFGLLIVRAVLNIINNVYLFRNPYKVLSQALFIIGLIFGVSYFGYPTISIDGLMIMQSISVLIGFIGFIGLGIAMELYGRKKIQANDFAIDILARKRMIGVAIGMVIIILLPLFSTIPTAISIDNEYNTWKTSRWDVQIQREVSWTRTAVGLSDFQVKPIQEYYNKTIISDIDMIHSMRQYDKDAAAKKMGNQIGTSFELLADSDIIYIPDGAFKGEYWVAPKTINTEVYQDSAVRRHTEIYDHIEGFLALDTYSGDLVPGLNFETIFGVPANVPIFFGEEQETKSSSDSSDNLFITMDSSASKAFEDDILLYTGWSENVSFAYSYQGDPDGTISGLEAFWYTLNMGLTNYAFAGGEKSFLINRNIKTRVMNALLPGMVIDPDPYLVFDRPNGHLYYAVSIATEINIGSFVQGPLYRFLGVCLIDTADGSLKWVRNPASTDPNNSFNPTNDPLYPMYQVFNEFYPWLDITDSSVSFLQSQIRYPEALWAQQLKYDFRYHVTNPDVYYAANDFYEKPENTIVYYIETDLGEGLEFVAVQLVEYVGQEAFTLAGMYVVRHGANFGQTLFFKVPKQQTVRFIGPQTALEEYRSQATQELALIQNLRHGNILLYPMANDLYYFIPTYSAPAGTERLQLAGLVNAFTKKVGYGDNAMLAYTHLGISGVETPVNVTTLDFNVTAPSEITYNETNWALIQAKIQSLELNDTVTARNLTLQLNIYGMNASVKIYGNEILPVNWTLGSTEVYNYTIANFLLYPSQGFIFPIRLIAEPSSAGVILYYNLEIIENGIPILTTGGKTLTILNPDFN
jgi:hypothetical protein